jgi:hypothetical protein
MSEHHTGFDPPASDPTPAHDPTPGFDPLVHHQHLAMMHAHVEAAPADPNAKPAPAWFWHLIATLVTSGLWLPFWIYFALIRKKKS